MQIVLLSGGSGKRLWPLSNEVRSKQFLKLFTDENDQKESIVQRVYKQIKEAQPNASITVATNNLQYDSIREHLNDEVDVVLEPSRRDTYPAIALACVYLALEKKTSLEETIIVLPVDPFTELSFFRTLSQMDTLIQDNKADLALIGIKPLLPTSKYGYIIPKAKTENISYVDMFVEKPDEETAANLINIGSYWNGGVFAFKLHYLLSIIEADVNFINYQDLYNKYSQLEKISFDYKVAEKASNVAVIPYYGKWTDIGTWRTLTDEMPQGNIGSVVSEKTRNTYVINELNIPIVALGTKDIVVVASNDGILVSDLMESANLKSVVEKL